MFAQHVQVTVRTNSQRPAVVGSKAVTADIMVGPLLIPRRQSTTISAAMRNILPCFVSGFQGNTTPRAVGNPILNFPVFIQESGAPVAIFADDGANQPAHFDFFQFAKLSQMEYEVCYSTSLGGHGYILADFRRRRAYHTKLTPGSQLEASNPIRHVWKIRYFGLLPCGDHVQAASQPRVTEFKNGLLQFMPQSATLLLNSELSSVIDGEPVGNGIIFSLKTPEATFNYKDTEFQHFFISLKYPRIVHGKTYYGGQVTTLHNAGAKIVSEVVDLHQALLRQVLFGSVHKPLMEELGILDAADVFVSYDELHGYHSQSRMLLEAPHLLDYSGKEMALTDFGRAADILTKFAEKLEDLDETMMLQTMCLFGKLQAELFRGLPAGKVFAHELQNQLLERARSIKDNGKRHELFDFFRAKSWEIEFDQLFPSVSQALGGENELAG